MQKLLFIFFTFYSLLILGEVVKENNYYIAPHLSSEAKAVIKSAPPEKLPFKNDEKSFRETRELFDTFGPAEMEKLKQNGVIFEIKKETVNDVACYWITTPKTTNTDCLLIYTHGGGYICGSASYLVNMPIQIANAAGIKILSIDYSLAPDSKFPIAVNECVKVYKYLLKNNYKPEKIGWFGDSAGGGLALAAVLALKDKKLPLPGALTLISPWADLTASGETSHTLVKNDPFLLPNPSMDIWAKAYAGKESLKNPLISPVFGNFKGLPPMLIQAGTKEVLLSDAVRIARKAREDGVNVTLDIWDGMWHDFQSLANTPEAEKANKEIGLFFKKNLEAK